jgi:hypothetical protein
VETGSPKAKVADSEKKATSAEKKADEGDADEVTPEYYKDDFDESVRSESQSPGGANSMQRAAQARQRGNELAADGDAEEIDEEVGEVGEDEQSRSSDGNFRLRDRDEPSSLANDPTVHSDPSLNLDYVEDVVSQH